MKKQIYPLFLAFFLFLSPSFAYSNATSDLFCLIRITQELTGVNTNDAKAQLEAYGGKAPYTYKWSTGATTQTVSRLSAGTITGTVTDAKGRKSKCSAVIVNNYCKNVTNAGSICCSQTYCQTFEIKPLTETTPASGGNQADALQYKWMYYTTDVFSRRSSWSVINGATGKDLPLSLIPFSTATGPLSIVRCVRRANCSEFLESNIVQLTPNGFAAISGPKDVFLNQNVTYTAAENLNDATYFWTYSGGGYSGISSTFSFSYLGQQMLQLTVTTANCTIVSNMMVTVHGVATNTYGNFAPTNVHQVNGKEVLFDGSSSSTQIDKNAVKKAMPNKGILAYPSPAQNVVFIEMPEAEQSKGTIEVYNNVGGLVQSQKFESAQTRYQINTENLPTGTYIIKVQNSDGHISTTKINKM